MPVIAFGTAAIAGVWIFCLYDQSRPIFEQQWTMLFALLIWIGGILCFLASLRSQRNSSH